MIKANAIAFRDLFRTVLNVYTINMKNFDKNDAIESLFVKNQIIDTFNDIKQLKFNDDDDEQLKDNLDRAKNLCGQINRSIDVQPLEAMCNHVTIAIMTWDMKQANRKCYESRAKEAGVKRPSNYLNLYNCFREHYPQALDNLNNLIHCPLAYLDIRSSELWTYLRGDVYKEITSPVLAEYFKD